MCIRDRYKLGFVNKIKNILESNGLQTLVYKDVLADPPEYNIFDAVKLFHNFDADPSDSHKFTWTELYRNDAALLNHLNNPPVQDYVQKHMEIAESLEVEIYGTLSDETFNFLTDAWNEAGIPFKYFKTTRVGFVRDSILN